MPTDRRPNILGASFEDTYPFYGCHGNGVTRTPKLDRLAAQGGIWPRAFSTAGGCAPARSAVIADFGETSTCWERRACPVVG